MSFCWPVPFYPTNNYQRLHFSQWFRHTLRKYTVSITLASNSGQKTARYSVNKRSLPKTSLQLFCPYVPNFLCSITLCTFWFSDWFRKMKSRMSVWYHHHPVEVFFFFPPHLLTSLTLPPPTRPWSSLIMTQIHKTVESSFPESSGGEVLSGRSQNPCPSSGFYHLELPSWICGHYFYFYFQLLCQVQYAYKCKVTMFLSAIIDL